MALRVLVLGGGRFVGYHLVLAARARGWDVTVFNHDATAPVAAGIRWVRGERENYVDLRPLARSRWDLVIDTWAGDPTAVADSVGALNAAAAKYCYVSSIVAGAAEATAEIGSYAARKRLSEAHVLRRGPSGLVVRFGLVIGPNEYCGRMPYWLRYLARDRPAIGPGCPERPIMYHDVRDVADAVLTAATADRSGLVTAAPVAASADTMGSLLQACSLAVGRSRPIHWVSDAVLLDCNVTPWTGLPLWLPMFGTVFDAYDYRADVAHERCGRSAADTAAATWKWLRGNRSRRELELRPFMPYDAVDALVDSSGH